MLEKTLGTFKRASEEQGYIFDIQKFSVHDGPGIRTVVFLKGCALSCQWCSNPEGMGVPQEIMWKQILCTHCGKCNALCPKGAISDAEDGRKIIDADLCIRCGTCDRNCYARAIELVGRYVTVEEVLEEVEKDRPFYEGSGGGITLGGGECLCQPTFAAALLRESKARGLNTAIETASYVPWSHFEQVLDYVDLFIADVKHMDPVKHKEYTGASNELILSNLRELGKRKASILLRVPVIPGKNDSEENILQTVAFAREIGARQMELLPYHRMGQSKYGYLGKEYPVPEIEPPEKEYMEYLKSLVQL